MINDKRVLAIVPARGGSKGIPGKNIKPLAGKPLIAYTIEEALKSKYIDTVAVSTDDNGIAEVAVQYGAVLPYMRPVELAMDATPGIDPILHMVDWYDKHGEGYDLVICLQCTSPFRRVEQIDESLELLLQKKGASIVSVCEISENPYWMKTIDQSRMKNFLPQETLQARRQDMPPIYILNGAIYIADIKFLLEQHGWYDDDTLAYVMDVEASVDIDNNNDFEYAEYLMWRKKKTGESVNG